MKVILFFLPFLCIFSGCGINQGIERSYYVSQTVNEEIPEEVIMDDSKTSEVIPLGE